MRDFRDAKAMAQTLRAALATKGSKITVSESLELIAQTFGVGGEPKQTAGFQRVVQRAAHYAEGRGRPNRTGAELLVAIFAETESPAARLLGQQGMTRQDAINFIIHGAAKGGVETAV
jgi:ATP-dependent Clp protease ATP-binding subunit ClpA